MSRHDIYYKLDRAYGIGWPEYAVLSRSSISQERTLQVLEELTEERLNNREISAVKVNKLDV